ncbi:SprT family zinc-dependent metalloprotease [Flaviaesturariibacter amylovorans]|uniref:SprT family zinc-dependent metalloprotease n=1 Tax=Flaviaesturariibacter amylovorans TaxID=1084520 RepID=A0ABP8H9I2_9BACT
MIDRIHIGEIEIEVTRKNIKNVHLTVHPPDGRVTLVAPLKTRLEVARAFALSKLYWIRQQQEKMAAQARESPRQLVKRETHYLWGRRYLLDVIPTEVVQQVILDHKRIRLHVKPGASKAKREELLYAWQKALLHAFIKDAIAKWEKIMDVQVRAYFVQKMKTKWGSCNHKSGTIRLNTELVKKPKDLVEYVIVHEMAHLIEPTHNAQFVALLDKYYPSWREARMELNELPLGYVEWK